MKIIIPVSLLTALLVWSGWLEKGQFVIQPIMQWIHLPAEAALPLLIGLTTSFYGAIAAMAMLTLSKAHMTLIAIFLLIAHSLIQECAIQGKSGIKPFKALLYRLAAATITVLVVAPFLDVSATVQAASSVSVGETQPVGEMLLHWLVTTTALSLKLLVIVVGILTLLEVSKGLGWIDRIVVFCRPVFKIMGLSEKAGIIWITATVFGLIYGAAVIVEETKGGYLEPQELEGLHLSIGINHSIIEDPALFMTLGLDLFWLVVPRLVMAIVVVRIFFVWCYLRKRYLAPAV